MGKVLPQSFFNRPTLEVAEELLGCFLCRRVGKKVMRLEITEVEAYDGPEDKASHAVLHRAGGYKAVQTARNAPMFGEAGVWYVYFTYGMHWLLNIVTGPVGYPAAILIRGGRLNPDSQTIETDSLTVGKHINGPARLTKFLQVDGRFNRKKASPETGLWIERGKPIAPEKIKRTPRIGVAYAREWAKAPYRFLCLDE